MLARPCVHTNTSLFIAMLSYLSLACGSPSVWLLCPLHLSPHYLSVLLFPGTIRCSRLILYVPSPRVSHFLKELQAPPLKRQRSGHWMCHCSWVLLCQALNGSHVRTCVCTCESKHAVASLGVSVSISI